MSYMTKSSIVLDLDDPRFDDIAEVMSNKTAKKILSALGEKELSQSEISEEIGAALNTVDYNVKKLEKAGLVEKVSGFLWSVKGKRIHKYRVVNKKIVISPKSYLKGILPAAFVSVVLAFLIKIFVGTTSVSSGNVGSLEMDVATSGSFAAVDSVPRVALEEGARAASESASIVNNSVHQVLVNTPESWAWFLLGSLVALLFLIIFNWRKNE